MFFEEAEEMYHLYKISPELTCTCDEYHTCQSCNHQESTLIGKKNDCKWNNAGHCSNFNLPCDDCKLHESK